MDGLERITLKLIEIILHPVTMPYHLYSFFFLTQCPTNISWSDYLDSPHYSLSNTTNLEIAQLAVAQSASYLHGCVNSIVGTTSENELL